MSILQLKYFKALAEGETLTKTASQLFITAPALSNSIRKLEQDLGVQLFDRTSKNIQLNKYGKEYLEYVTQALTILENGERALNTAMQENGRLSVAITISGFWFNLFASYQDMYPGVQITRSYEPLSALNADMLLQKYDCVLASPNDIQNKKLDYHMLYDNAKPFLAVHKDNPLASLTSISLFDVNETFVLPSTDMSEGAYYHSIMNSMGFKPRNSYICESIVREKSIQANRGVTLATSHTIFEGKMSDDVVYIPISDICEPHSQAIIMHSSRFQTKPLRDFISLAKDFYKNVW